MYFFQLNKDIIFYFNHSNFEFIIIFSWIIFPLKLLSNSNETTNKPLDLNMEFFQVESYYKTLMSIKPLFYGGTQLSYTLLNVIGLFFIILLVFYFKKKKFFQINKIKKFYS